MADVFSIFVSILANLFIGFAIFSGVRGDPGEILGLWGWPRRVSGRSPRFWHPTWVKLGAKWEAKVLLLCCKSVQEGFREVPGAIFEGSEKAV